MTQCPVESAIVQTLIYFEMFSYPLTDREVWQFASYDPTEKGDARPEVSFEVFRGKLQQLVEQGIVYVYQGYYQTRNHPEWVERRRDNNRRADTLLPVARRMARLIAAFPYIRAVFVSGSMSKHSMKPDSDIDFFLITTPGRLWLARTLLVVFKKLFLFNSHKYFCINYFIDTEHLAIEEKNLFTAIEMVTLLPMYGSDGYHSFCRHNDWAWHTFPNCPQRPLDHVPPYAGSWFKRGIEWLLNSNFGTWLDQQAMQVTVGYWRKKFKHLDDSTFSVALKSRRHISKHHPLFFQKKVLDYLSQRMREMEK